MRSSTNEEQSSLARKLELQTALYFSSKKKNRCPLLCLPTNLALYLSFSCPLESPEIAHTSVLWPPVTTHLSVLWPSRTAHPSESYLAAQEQLLLEVARKKKLKRKNKIKKTLLSEGVYKYALLR